MLSSSLRQIRVPERRLGFCISMELGSAAGAAAFPPKQERRGTQSCPAGRLVLVRSERPTPSLNDARWPARKEERAAERAR
jgi:hypothetical protein